MTHTIVTVKPEIRILGLDTCKSGQVFGAIVRGGTYIDGFVHFRFSENTSKLLGRKILATKYYPELRAIMLHDPKDRVVARTIERMTGLPVIAVLARGRGTGNYLVFRSRRGTMFHRSNVADATINKILNLTWTYESLPEPVRVAHLLSRQRLREARAL